MVLSYHTEFLYQLYHYFHFTETEAVLARGSLPEAIHTNSVNSEEQSRDSKVCVIRKPPTCHRYGTVSLH